MSSPRASVSYRKRQRAVLVFRIEPRIGLSDLIESPFQGVPARCHHIVRRYDSLIVDEQTPTRLYQDAVREIRPHGFLTWSVAKEMSYPITIAPQRPKLSSTRQSHPT